MRTSARRIVAPAVIGVLVIIFGWRSDGAAPRAYEPLTRGEASVLTGGQTGCPTMYFSYIAGCPYSNGGSCSSYGNGSCTSPQEGGNWACNYNCDVQQGIGSGNATSGQGSITSMPCPSVPSAGCRTTVVNLQQNLFNCTCTQGTSSAQCSYGNGYYLGLTGCSNPN